MTIGVDLLDETRAFNEELRALIETLPAIETVPVEATRLSRYEAGGIFPPPEFVEEARWVDIPSRGGGLRAPDPGAGGRGPWCVRPHSRRWVDDRRGRPAGRPTAAARPGDATRRGEHRIPPCAGASVSGSARRLRGRRAVAARRRRAAARRARSALDRRRVGWSASLRDDAPAAPRPSRRRRSLTRREPRLRRIRPERHAQPPSDRRPDPAHRSGNALVHRKLPAGARRRAAPRSGDLAALCRPGGPAAGALHDRHRRPAPRRHLFMAARWDAAGNEAELLVYAGGIHAFNAFPIGIGLAANAAQTEFLRSSFAD